MARPTARDWVLLATLGAIWGAAFMATKVAAADLGPFTIAAGRLLIGALSLVAVLALRGERLPGSATGEERRFWRAALAIAFLSNAMPFTALAWGQRYVDSGLAGVFMASVPLFVLPLGHLFVPGEVMTLRKTAGFLLGFVGVAVLIGPAVLLDLGGGDALMLLAQGACLLAAFGYASGSVVSKLAPQLGLIRFAAAALMLAAAMTLPLAFALEAPLAARPGAEAVLATVYLGLLPTALATLMLLSVIQSAGPGFFSMVNYQVPVWAVVLGILVLGESPSPSLGVALILILIGLAIAQGRLGLRRGAVPRG